MGFLGLWFDVGNERYTTLEELERFLGKLWFDVGNERYTTITNNKNTRLCCGLM